MNNFTGTASAAAHSDEYSGRIDYNFTDYDRINARWSQKYETRSKTSPRTTALRIGGARVHRPNNRYSINVGLQPRYQPDV